MKEIKKINPDELEWERERLIKKYSSVLRKDEGEKSTPLTEAKKMINFYINIFKK